MRDNIIKLWNELYLDDEMDDNSINILEQFLDFLDNTRLEFFSSDKDTNIDWYKDAVIYSTYADLFNKDLIGLKDKLQYLKELGINCIWLLPILESPMKDAGFDISNYESIRHELLGLPESASIDEKNEVFEEFVQAAHDLDIRIIFDIAMNHCSIEHPWFVEGRKSKESPYRDYFIWSDDKDKYKEARIIFKGLCESNWEYDELAGQYFLHRFFEIQPDLNYRNPQVLVEMMKVLIGWKIKGVDGFRADAVPYIWKEEGTICENLPKTHTVVKFFRAVLDYLQPGSLLLAEACQPPKEVVEYFGNGDECNAAYHFPVMPQVYKAMAEQDGTSIMDALDPGFTPEIPPSCQWFMFLRCHDELTLEMVTPHEREVIYNHYVTNPLWDFRQGEGIASRLSELFNFDHEKILLANSIMMTLIGTPIIFYGDEFAKGNDLDYYNKIAKETGYADTRYLCRGPIDWDAVDAILENEDSIGARVFNGLKEMTKARRLTKAFSRGGLEFLEVEDLSINPLPQLLAYKRKYMDDEVIVIQNLSPHKVVFKVKVTEGKTFENLLNSNIIVNNIDGEEAYEIEGNSYHWLFLNH